MTAGILKYYPVINNQMHTALSTEGIYILHHLSSLLPTSGKYRSCSVRALRSLNCSQTGNPDTVLIVSGDFNQTNLKKIMPDVHQHID